MRRTDGVDLMLNILSYCLRGMIKQLLSSECTGPGYCITLNECRLSSIKFPTNAELHQMTTILRIHSFPRKALRSWIRSRT